MNIVWIKLRVLPEKELELTQTLLSMVEPTRKEAGCVSYSFHCDVEEKLCYNLLEEWSSRMDLYRHLKTARFGVLLGLKALLSKPLQIMIYGVSTTEGIELVKQVRIKA